MFPKNSSTFLLIIIVFFVSFAASGIVPLFANTLKQHHITWGFIPYFSFVLIGQITIYFDRYKKVTTSMIPILVLAFTSTLVFFNLLLTKNNSIHIVNIIIFFRVLEGFVVGLSLPLIFEKVINSTILQNKDQRLVLLNSSNLLGYLLGIISSDLWERMYPHNNFLTPLIIILCILSFIYFYIDKRTEKQDPYTQPILTKPNDDTFYESIKYNLNKNKTYYWLQTFFLLFLAKSYYGYFFSYLLYEKEIVIFNISQVVILVCLLNFLGQITASIVSKHIGLNIFTLLSSGLFFLTLIIFSLHTKLILFLCLSFLHAMIYFLGLKRIAIKPNNAKTFALINALSDPGMVLGSMLSMFDSTLSILFLAFLAAYPVLEKYLLKQNIQK